MIRDLRITFEMELDRVEEYMPAHRLRAMWEFAMDLLIQFQEAALSRDEGDSGSCHDESTTHADA